MNPSLRACLRFSAASLCVFACLQRPVAALAQTSPDTLIGRRGSGIPSGAVVDPIPVAGIAAASGPGNSTGAATSQESVVPVTPPPSPERNGGLINSAAATAVSAASCFPSADHPLAPLESYKDTYILPYAYDTIGSPDRMHEEFKFQISFRKEVFRCTPFHLYAGYTQLSLWQFYHGSNAKYFRASDYNPEVFFVVDHLQFLGDFQAGIEHQSNGVGGLDERSWNRLYVQPHWNGHDDPFGVSLKLWWRFPDGDPATPSNPGGDDNPDIEDYLGIFELRPWWNFGPYHRLSAMYRRGYKDSTDTVELDYDVTVGYPGSGIKARLQVFSGYGETLIDYKRQVNRIGLGFLFQ